MRGTTTTAAESLGGAVTLLASARSESSERSPTRVARYRIIGRLGSGGMGVVYAARDPELDRRVAIKLLNAGSDDLGGRLLREAQALARLSHPNVVQVHDAGTFGERLFMAMEMVEGETLRTWLALDERPWRAILEVFLSAGKGLVAAHVVGIIHRDFKPDNVLVGRDGRARVADFGLARQGDAASSEGATPSSANTGAGILEFSLTATGAILGTPAYMAPEQIAGLRADARSDIFSFCVALFEALYGRRPFTGESLGALALQMREGTIAAPPAGSPVPTRIHALLCRGLAYDPGDRYASLEVLLSELSDDPGRRRRGFFVSIGLALAIAGGSFATARSSIPGSEAYCSGGAAALAPIWGDVARGEVERSMGRADVVPAVRTRVLAGLDAYAARWTDAYQAACMAHLGGDDSAALRDSRMLCLDRRRDAFGSAVKLMGALRPADDISRVLAGLPGIDECGRLDALAEESAARDEPARREVKHKVERAGVLAALGHYHEAAAFDAAIDAATVGGTPQLLARAFLARALVYQAQMNFDAAAADLRQALAAALRAEDPSTAAEVASRLIDVSALTDVSLGEVLAGAPLAAALVDRLPSPELHRRRLRFSEGTAKLVKGDREGARASMEEAVEDMPETLVGWTLDTYPSELAKWLGGLAKIEDSPERHRDLFAHAEALLVEGFGPKHPEVLGLWRHRGPSAPDLDDGRVDLMNACEGFRRNDPPRINECSECHLLLGQTLELLGDKVVAAEAFAEVARCFRGSPGAAQELQWFGVRSELAATALAELRGDHAEVLAAGDRAHELLAPAASRWRSELLRAEVWLRQGRALRALGRRSEALAALERAHEAFIRNIDKSFDTVVDFEKAEVASLLAEALAEDASAADASAAEGGLPTELRRRASGMAIEARSFYAARGERWRPQVEALDELLRVNAGGR